MLTDGRAHTLRFFFVTGARQAGDCTGGGLCQHNGERLAPALFCWVHREAGAPFVGWCRDSGSAVEGSSTTVRW